VPIVHIATFSHAKIHAHSFNSFYVIKGPVFLADRHTDGQTKRPTNTQSERKNVVLIGHNATY